jgi:small subunit ribosomal protein S5
VVIGDHNGRVGYASGKAKEVAEAVGKGIDAARGKLIQVRLDGTTIPREAQGKAGKCCVTLKPGPAGTGVVADLPVGAVMESAGIQDVLTESQGPENPYLLVEATFAALQSLGAPAVSGA